MSQNVSRFDKNVMFDYIIKTFVYTEANCVFVIFIGPKTDDVDSLADLRGRRSPWTVLVGSIIYIWNYVNFCHYLTYKYILSFFLYCKFSWNLILIDFLWTTNFSTFSSIILMMVVIWMIHHHHHHYPILIKVYPRKRGWPDLPYSNSNSPIPTLHLA